MRPFQCDLQPELQETHRTTHTRTTIVAEHRGGTNRVRNDRSRTRRTHEVPFIVACSHFTRKNTTFRAPASSPQHSPSNIHAAIPLRSASTNSRNAYDYAHSFKNYITTSHRPHLPSSPLPFITTSLRHRFPSSTLPIVPTSLRHHSPSSPLPFVTTSLPHHFPSSPPCVIASYSFVMYC